MTEGVTVTYRPADDANRRVRFEPLARPAHSDEWYRRVTERYVDGGWRKEGSEPVRQVEIEAGDGESVATVFSGP
ncbi:hypothetical protein HLRTI_002158 [Halorhabdus tiamatea SARL4B]|uniref:Uncharacterized protein n=1 Tax=Halorhabdus tiamatea SARL4B TaxID=1033806 RepID=F7PJE8_9EURY|nr:hypothetical protein [Halorhabdus tiamatea]ERJ05770.1 hypothetical protein HLRTI_002158 [Halorhabdus tiamatea SARL4B]CCQ34296.1 hypothetical protein HTIA_2184 [Halorhabdus tiamatea SARL4B]